jgi:hypothetical protein
MTRPEETYIVRVRPDRRDAIVEDMRSGERSHAREVAEVGTVITRLLDRAQARRTMTRRRHA